MMAISIPMRVLRAVLAALAILAAAAAVLAIVPAAAFPGPGPQPDYRMPALPVPPFLGDPFVPTPMPAPAPPRYARACDGSEPIFGGILGAAAGGVLAAALSEHDGRTDPDATLFGVITGAAIGATLVTSQCQAD
jgi:hypothetical protein